MIVANLHPLILDHSDAWQAYLDTLPWQNGHFDRSSHHAFLRAASMGISPVRAIPEVDRRCREAGGHPLASKLHHQYNSAACFTKTTVSADKIIIPKGPTPVFDYQKLQRIAERKPEVNGEWLAAKSPTPVDSATAATVLDQLYRPQEKVVVERAVES
jgi:hypothetical protein